MLARMQSFIYSPPDSKTRGYCALGVATCSILGLFHMVMAYGAGPAQAFGPGFDFTWVMYLLWAIKIPLLVGTLALVCVMPVLEVGEGAWGGGASAAASLAPLDTARCAPAIFTSSTAAPPPPRSSSLPSSG